MAGALNLVPPEMQESLTPYVDALTGKSPKEVQAALIGSLSSSPMGQEALSAIQRGQTFGVQDRQQKLAELRYEQELAAAGQPKPMSAYEEAQLGIRERETVLKEQEAAAKATLPEGMDPKTKAKFDQAYPQAIRNLQSSTTELDKDMADVQALINDEEGLNAITGVYGANTPNISAAARRAQASYDKIRAGAGFSALQAMRDASPTGGALGNVSNQEGAKLEQSVAAFAQVQDADDLRDVLRQYLIDLKMAQENVRAAFDETYSYRGETPSSDIVTQTRERRGQMERNAGKTPLPPGVTVKKRN
jgi:vacuolar-type H+-ATPase subunit I/STV1